LACNKFWPSSANLYDLSPVARTVVGWLTGQSIRRRFDMESVGTYELTRNLSKLLERVERGERITITRRGKPVAVLGPPPSEKPDVKKVIEEFKSFAKGRSLGDISIRELIDEGRRF
jgi:prevent-host-death family protein